MPSPLRILHLEDDLRDSELLQAKLESEDILCHVIRVETQVDFCAALEQGGFDLILADYTLPSFDGLSALKITLETCPDVPFIFVSGTLGEEVSIEALKIGATDYVLKERLSRIVPSVHRALREARERAERKRAEALLAGEKRLLKMIAKGHALSMILDALCRLVEELSTGSLASILLLDPDGKRLWHGAAPSLPQSYTDAIDGGFIGPAAGSCGTAAYRKEPIIVADIAQDPLWADYRDLALPHGLRACWSTPVLASDGRVLGTFAIYSREPGSPTPQQHNIIEQITNLTSIAIERQRAEEERQAHLGFLETMDQVNRAIQGTNDLEQMMSDVLDAVLTVFQCDRAWLVYPCDPEALWHGVKMQRTRPEFPGLFSVGLDVPVDPETADVLRTVRAASGPVRFGPGSPHPLPATAGAAPRHPVPDRHGPLPEGRSTVHVRSQPVRVPASLDTAGRAALPGDRPTAGRRPDQPLDVAHRARKRAPNWKRPSASRTSATGSTTPRRIASPGRTKPIASLGCSRRAQILSLAQLSELIHPEDQQIMVQAVAEALRGGRRYDVEYRVVRPNGEVRIVHSQGDVMRDESGRPRRMFGTVQDITERKRAEQRLVAQHTVTQILAEAVTLPEATPQILQAVCECLDWDLGALWSLDRQAGVLRCVEMWHKASVEAPHFEATSRASTFLPGIGLPGRVWSSRAPAYIPDVVHDANFLRAPIAAREGLHTAFGFPILLGGDVLGVMEFFSHEHTAARPGPAPHDGDHRQPDRPVHRAHAGGSSAPGERGVPRRRAAD